MSSTPSPALAGGSGVAFVQDDIVAVQRDDGAKVAKVLRSGPLVLMGMHHVEGALYAVDVQDVWVQQDVSLVRFIDAVWSNQHQCYEVRAGLQ